MYSTHSYQSIDYKNEENGVTVDLIQIFEVYLEKLSKSTKIKKEKKKGACPKIRTMFMQSRSVGSLPLGHMAPCDRIYNAS